ncbi:MAG TPA: ABC transporter ATP-binding protein [Micromonosporaceae bacterium]|jgi:ATP-binding cassette subfamily B protein
MSAAPSESLVSSARGVLAVIRLLPRISRRRTTQFWAGCIGAAILPVATVIAMGLLIGSVVRTNYGGASTAVWLVAVVVLTLATRGVRGLLDTLAVVLGRELELYLQDHLIATVAAPVGIEHVDREDLLTSLRTARRLGLDLDRPERAVQGLAELAPSWLSAAGAAIVLITFSWWLGLLWLVSWPVLVILMQTEYVRIGRATYDRSREFAEAEYLRDLAISAEPAKEIRIWGMLRWLLDRFDQAWDNTMEPIRQTRRLRKRVVVGTTAYLAVLFTATLVMLVRAGLHGAIGIGALGVYLMVSRTLAQFDAFDDANVYLALSAVSVPRILALERQLPTVSGPSGTRTLPAAAPERQLAFTDVRFSYPRAERPTLDGLSLSIPAGSSLAIVGRNGAGKTSLIKLLCGFYRPECGTITVDGVDLATVDAVDWRNHVSVLFQDFTRYHLSMRENITLGAPAYANNEKMISDACERLGLEDLIASLPYGLDTVLSKEYSHGIDLSGGQWQQVALARAMFAVEAGARILILDEPAAALDVRAEAALYSRFLDITSGLTTVVISHRYSTVRQADRIAVLDRGRIVELGSHEELMAADGRYSRSFALQAQRIGL